MGAAGPYIAITAAFEREVDILEQAIADMEAAGLLDEVAVQLVTGPDEYLFGEEKALLEALEGARQPCRESTILPGGAVLLCRIAESDAEEQRRDSRALDPHCASRLGVVPGF